ncbi:MAG: hypothetical protein EWV63_08985 [Microcystis aeruginosa Ma_OC_H_19870700_S124]|uniref:Membrane protein 6-pyruvoyl-tetrahydropterin synthase-related domain-containing protein n=1 Tax=Microcystis aeruginosa Ma_OC_H_19870700_S124 TaxID=2486262 RepID=A0A552AP86_MICAE|nr:hypothetical protein [Burkholderiales bacterium]TRT87272.1 MAG: hypothetical protein EWV63_08985 [Microcystis aeruginosa Ma_OC_H_19870700_S124]
MNILVSLARLHRKQLSFALLVFLIIGSTWLAFLFAPERTNDGLVHLFWNSFWAEQVKSGDLFPKWYAQGYGGFGNAAFLFYPPLLRYVAFPYHLLGFYPVVALRLTVLTILLINIISASTLAAYLFKRRGILYYQLIIILAINPYLFYCLFWRGALAECLAIALMPFFIVALLKVSNVITFANGLALTITTSLIALAHLPSLIIIFFLFGIYSVIILLKTRNFRDFGLRILFFIIGLIFSFPYLIPAVFNLKEIRQPIGTSLGDWVAFGNNFHQNRQTFIISLIFSIYLIIYLLSIRAVWQRRNQLEKFNLFSLIVLSGLSLLMISPLSLPLYKIIFPLQKIQFPFRFIAVAAGLVSTLAILCISGKFNQFKKRLLVSLLVIASVSIPHYFLLSSVLTPVYQDSLAKEQLNNLITARIKQPSYQSQRTAAANFLPVEPIKVGGKGFNLAAGLLIVPDVVDYLPAALSEKTPFWKFQGNTVSPAQGYQDHYVRNGNGQLAMVKASSYNRIWDCQIVSDTQVDLGITYFSRWHFETNPKGMISSQGISQDGLFTLQLKPGKYQLIAQYRA